LLECPVGGREFHHDGDDRQSPSKAKEFKGKMTGDKADELEGKAHNRQVASLRRQPG
jgi:hypothetical protein